MGLWGYSSEELASEIKRRALGTPLSRDHSPDGNVDLHATWVKIPDAGISAATDDGATPSVTSCVTYEATGADGALEKCVDSAAADITIDVLHYGAAIAAAADHDFKFLQVKRMFGGWVVDVEYCNE